MSGLEQQFREGKERDMQLEEISNINDLDFSFNFSFSDNDLTDLNASDSNVTTSNSQLVLSSGTIGNWISKNKTTASDVTTVEIKALGEALQDARFYVSADAGTHWQSVSLNTLTTVTDVGKNLRLKIEFTTANTRVGSAVILYS